MKSKLLLLPSVVLLLTLACAPQKETEALGAETYFPIPLGGRTVHLQLALTESERSQGLMHREKLEPDHGMLFLFPNAAPRSFWMRNTGIPLDLGYFDASGELLEVHALHPYDETGAESRNKRIWIAVEMNQGWFAQNDIRNGAKLDLTALREAVAARGKNPAAYSLTP